ncbi:MAG: hypothetical protein J4473_03075 [Candidatus Aenigmarchaeota archaeon]|nr:hypothetical protein [Candidatus Aenigmarchaeota archaeon]
MQEQKHIEALKEVMETIDFSIKDNRGLIVYQRRLTAMLSLGSQHILELYLHKINAIKPGTQLKHEWLKMEEKNLEMQLAGILTKSLSSIPDSSYIFALAKKIETDRNDLVYGSNLKNDNILREKISIFLDLKKFIEQKIGDII